MKNTSASHWEFGGWLADMPPQSAWAILVIALALGFIAAHLSYRKLQVSLSPTKRRILFYLRTTFFATLLLCLANPTRVQQQFLPPPTPKPLAVLIDRSDSMTNLDNRGTSRIQDAWRVWEKIRGNGQVDFPEIHWMEFTDKSRSITNFDPHSKTTLANSGQTHLYSNIQKLLDSHPPGTYGGLLGISDGLDTTHETAESAVAASLRAGTPLYFLPGANRARSGAYLTVREVDLPTKALRQSQFTYHAVVEAMLGRDEQVLIRLLDGTQLLKEERLSLKKGSHLLEWSHQIEAGEIGERDLRLELRSDSFKSDARNKVLVADKIPIKVLYYQGALDWGYRFLSSVLARDPSFEITALFTPVLGGRMRATSSGNSPFQDLPDNAEALKPYQIVVLANVFASQLSEAQERALEEYTRQGGGLLFLPPAQHAATAFANSRLETILPVVFERATPQSTKDAQAEAFRKRMRQTRGGVNGPQEVAFAEEAERRHRQNPLTPFSVPNQSPLARILQLAGKESGSPIIPKFASYARIQDLKPGAQVLAVHPTDVNESTGEPRPLLATQIFGKGRTSVLGTDSLWRWRMSLPSDSVEASAFWQQLLLWMAQSQSLETLRFRENFAESPLGKPVELTALNTGERPEFLVSGPGSTVPNIEGKPGNLPGEWVIRWTPDVPGEWEISVQLDSKPLLKRYVYVRESGVPAPDLANRPPALDRLAMMAAATGGQLIRDGAPPPWKTSAHQTSSILLAEQRDLLWNKSWVLLFCLGLYGSELLLRRRWRLI